jgi:IS5 family transposase
MASLLYLKHVYALSDEDTIERWSENPYWQHFSGERYFQHELPCDPSSLVRCPPRVRIVVASIEPRNWGRG